MDRSPQNGFGQQLTYAIRTDDLETIRGLLDIDPELVNAGTDLHRRERSSDAFTMPLIHLAIAEAKMDVLRLLIERGADLNVRNGDGRLPLHDCLSWTTTILRRFCWMPGLCPTCAPRRPME